VPTLNVNSDSVSPVTISHIILSVGKYDSSELVAASTLSEFPAAVSLNATVEELDNSSISHLLYLDIKLERYSHLLQALINYGSSINLIHESIVSLLKIPIKPYISPKVSLADGKTILSCNSYVVLSYSILSIPR
jgi:hypothetical protein